MRASLFVRLVALGVVAASPFLQPVQRPGTGSAVIYVVDRSSSVGADALDQALTFVKDAATAAAADGTRLGLLAFDGHAQVLARPGEDLPSSIARTPDAWSTDVAGAVRLATATMPRGGYRRIVLLTDARATHGDAAGEIAQAAARGIRVDVVPLLTERDDGVRVRSARPRATRVAEKEPVTIDVALDGPGPNAAPARQGGNAYVTIKRDGEALPGRFVRFDHGHASAVVADQPGPGTHVYEIRASDRARGESWGTGDDDKPAAHEPPPTLVAVTAEGKPRAVIFGVDSSVPPVLHDALDKAGIQEVVLPIEKAGDAAATAGADLVALVDAPVVPAGASASDGLTPQAQQHLIDFVQRGGGLLATGGAFGFAPEYAGTPLARVLPVEIDDKGRAEDPPVALAIMLDRSGSMAARVGEHTKIQLAVEAAIAASSTLRATDQLAIASVDTETHWDLPLGPVTSVDEHRDQIRRITAGGGGIYVFTALRDAYAELEKVKAPIRHVILFSDTGDSEEQFMGCPFRPCATTLPTAQDLARAARKRGITTTVVGIGLETEQDTEFLRDLAAAVSGRFYLTTQGTDLRRIFVSETRVIAQSNLRAEPTALGAPFEHPALVGLDPARLPPVAAFSETARRPSAETALVTRNEGRPILATWRYGLGKVAALTVDMRDGWRGAWAESPEAAQMLRQTVRHVARQQSAWRADARVTVRAGEVTVRVDAPPDVEARAAAAPGTGQDAAAGRVGQLELVALDARGAATPITAALERVAPGRWMAHARTPGLPLVVARVRDGNGALLAEAIGQDDRTLELAEPGVDERVAREWARLGSGAYAPAPVETLRRDGAPGKVPVPVWPWALLGAAGLVVIDLGLRRLGRRRRAAQLPAGALAPA